MKVYVRHCKFRVSYPGRSDQQAVELTDGGLVSENTGKQAALCRETDIMSDQKSAEAIVVKCLSKWMGQGEGLNPMGQGQDSAISKFTMNPKGGVLIFDDERETSLGAISISIFLWRTETCSEQREVLEIA